MVTAEHKDRLLQFLTEQKSTTLQIKRSLLESMLDLEFEFIELILLQFKKFELCDFMVLGAGQLHISLTTETFDFWARGGFIAQEEYLSKSLDKLVLELKSLESSMPQKVAQITGIINNITSAISLFK